MGSEGGGGELAGLRSLIVGRVAILCRMKEKQYCLYETQIGFNR